MRRRSWLVGRLGLAAAAVVVAGLVSGLAAWVGAASQGVAVSFGSMVGAGLNVVPTALVSLGIGAVVLALAPRAASAVVCAVVIWSVLVDILGSMVTGLGWIDRSSLYHYMALAPANRPDLGVLALTTAVAVVLCAVAVVVFDRRDVGRG